MNNAQELLERLKQKISEKYDKLPEHIILCLGNPIMGDDVVGYIVAKKLKEKGLRKNLVYAGVNPLDFLRKLRDSDAKLIIVVDAIQAQLQPGEIIVDWLENIKEAETLTTTHSISLETLKRLVRKEMLVVGVQGSIYEIGARPTEPTAKAAATIAEALETLIKQEQADTHRKSSNPK